MSRVFEIDGYALSEEVKIMKGGPVELYPGVTVLIGCNGSGKTTFLTNVKNELKATGTPFFDYDIFSADRKLSYAASLKGGMRAAAYFNSTYMSEGEKIKEHMSQLAGQMGYFVNTECKKEKEAWLLFDSLDSGWSIDNVRDFARFLNDGVMENKPDQLDLYILIAANAYEFTLPEHWSLFDVQLCEHHDHFDSYDRYATFIMSKRRRKEAIWDKYYRAR